jgi:hypothetical protein
MAVPKSLSFLKLGTGSQVLEVYVFLSRDLASKVTLLTIQISRLDLPILR